MIDSRRLAVVLCTLAAALVVLPTVASSEEAGTPVEAVNEPAVGPYPETHRWSPAQMTVTVVGVVTLSNPTTVAHGVEWVGGPAKPTCEEGAGKVPVGTTPVASASKWSGKCTLSQPGTYTFYCTVHGAAMAGTITVNGNGTTTPTTTTTTPTATTTPTTPGEPPSGSPLAGSPSLRSSQRGGSVKGSLDIAQAGAGDRLEIDVFVKSGSLARAKRSTPVRVGRFVRSSVSAGRMPFVMKLDARARSALKRHRRLALTVKIALTPLYGEPFTVARGVVEHA
jgi:plastocyanin